MSLLFLIGGSSTVQADGISISGEYIPNGDLSNLSGVRIAPGGEFSYNASNKTLTMKWVTLESTEGLWNIGVNDFTIVLKGENYITGGGSGSAAMGFT